MTTSRKLVVAALLLVGGYGLAFVLGSLSELVLPGGGSKSAGAEGRGLLTTLKGFAPGRVNGPGTSELVSEPEFSARQAANRPTWLTATTLAATPEKNVSVTVASHPAFAAAPALGDNQLSESSPILPAANVSSTAQSAAAPKARITNVLAASAESTSLPASSWDRWPRWDSNSAAMESGPVAATFQNRTPGNPQAERAAYRHDDVVRRNSPALDRGAAAEGESGRMHVVADGDSLAKLAERYLDDANLDEEIYRLNRDVLSNPDLLPIGVELRIPDSRVADSTAALPASRGFAATKPSVPSGMVPVEWTPRAFDREPQAELLRPVAAGRAN